VKFFVSRSINGFSHSFQKNGKKDEKTEKIGVNRDFSLSLSSFIGFYRLYVLI